MTYLEEQKLRLQSNELTSMYDIVSNILYKISDNLYEAENFEELFSNFMLCRYLSMMNETFEYSKYLEIVLSTTDLSKKQFYKLAYALIPKQRCVYLKYIKKSKKNDKKEKNVININNEIVNNVMEL